MAQLNIVDGVFNIIVNQGVTARFANGVDEESLDAKLLTESNARIAADVWARGYPPSAPAEGKLWLRTVDDVRAVADFRAYDDGAPSTAIPSDDEDWDDVDDIIATPTYRGSQEHPRLLDYSDEFTGMYVSASPIIANGLMSSPSAMSDDYHTVSGFTLTNTRSEDGPLGVSIYRFTIGIGGLRNPSTDDDDSISRCLFRVGVFGYGGEGSGSNGPCAEARVDWIGTTPVMRVNAAWSTPTEIDPSGSTPTSIGRLFEAGDRFTCAVDFINNQWWVEVNGEEVDGTRMGANTDFDEAMDDLSDGVVTDIAQYKAMQFIAGHGNGKWETDIEWAAFTQYDYAPNLVTIHKYNGAAWVPEIVPMVATVLPTLPTPDTTAIIGKTFTVPLIGQWNDPVITGVGSPIPTLSLAVPMPALTPTPAESIHTIASYTLQPGAPLSDPTLLNLPTNWTVAQEVGGPDLGGSADIFGLFYYPAAYIPPEYLGFPAWWKFEMIDGDGFYSVCYAYAPGGIVGEPEDVDLFIFDSFTRYEMTIEAPGDDEDPGPVSSQEIRVTATSALTSPNARLTALEARVGALE